MLFRFARRFLVCTYPTKDLVHKCDGWPPFDVSEQPEASCYTISLACNASSSFCSASEPTRDGHAATGTLGGMLAVSALRPWFMPSNRWCYVHCSKLQPRVTAPVDSRNPYLPNDELGTPSCKPDCSRISYLRPLLVPLQDLGDIPGPAPIPPLTRASPPLVRR
jgi:hypothetical protein